MANDVFYSWHVYKHSAADVDKRRAVLRGTLRIVDCPGSWLEAGTGLQTEAVRVLDAIDSFKVVLLIAFAAAQPGIRHDLTGR